MRWNQFITKDIFRDEITAGAEVLMQKIKMYRPKIVAFNGRGLNKENLSIKNTI